MVYHSSVWDVEEGAGGVQGDLASALVLQCGKLNIWIIKKIKGFFVGNLCEIGVARELVLVGGL